MSFTARYTTRCAASCGEPIRPGQAAAYVDDQLVHVDCSRDSGLRQTPETICTSCWLAKPCDCEDD